MNTCTRFFPARDPDSAFNAYHFHDDPWKARWIHGPVTPDPSGAERELPGAWAFRKAFSYDSTEPLRIHVTADQRYDLFLDGVLVARGSERGTFNTWFYESYELTLDPGTHTLLARVWWPGTGDLQHFGHSSLRPGFLLHAEGPLAETLDTRSGSWEAARLEGYSFLRPQIYNGFYSIGARTFLDARLHDPALEHGLGSDWSPAVDHGEVPAFRASGDEPSSLRLLTPAVLPAMEYHARAIPAVRYAAPAPENYASLPIATADSHPDLESAWLTMLRGGSPVQIPAHTRERILLDLNDYVCGRTRLTLSRGAAARISLFWAESLYLDPSFSAKGNRNDVDSKFFHGMGDVLLCNGDENFQFSPFWWSSGRYLQVVIETDAEPLCIQTLDVEETHYPIHWDYAFDCDDSRWANELLPRTQRVLQMCSHESYMDCPYYEQLMYGGDTRLEILATYATTRDDRLPRKAILLFDRSRSESGLTLSRVPTRVKQVIPPFSLWFVHMVGDYARWRNDPAFVRARLSGTRAVLSAFWERLGSDDLIRGPHGWNFTDWVPTWSGGIPPSNNYDQAGATLNLHYIWTLRVAASLEETYGEKAFACAYRSLADRIQTAVIKHFWDPARSLFAEDPDHIHFSEHAQCMATLGGSIPDGQAEALANALATNPSLDRATVYYRHYLFDTWRVLHRPDQILRNLDLWFGLKDLGLYTVLEQPEPSRSDCHAWGAHPMFHALTSLAGIQPDAPNFSAIRIEPQPGPLNSLHASLPHPSGATISLNLQRSAQNHWTGSVTTPENIPSTLILNHQSFSWNGGTINV